MIEHKWICLSEKSFVDFIDNKSVFMYNTERFSMMHTDNFDFLQLVHKLQEPENLGSLEYLEVNNELVFEALEKGLLYLEKSAVKPLIFLPILNLQRDLDKGDSIESQLLIMGNKTRFVTGVNVCVNFPFNLSDKAYNSARIQAVSQAFVSTTNIDKVRSLSYEELEVIFTSLLVTNVKNVDVFINLDSMQNNQINRILSLFKKYPYCFRVHSFIDRVDFQIIKALSFSNENIVLNLYFDSYTSQESLVNLDAIITANLRNVSIRKFVYDKEDMLYESKIRLIPILTKENISFFKQYVYLSFQDILSIHPTMKEIMRNTKLNHNFFGVLDILPNGDILPHGSNICIGNISNKNFIIDAVINEFTNNRSWRLTRNLVGCRTCKFRYICPPISTVETSSNQFKICNF